MENLLHLIELFKDTKDHLRFFFKMIYPVQRI